MLFWSSCGDNGGARGKFECEIEGKCAGLGICKERPRERKSGRREAFGVVGTAWSSLLCWLLSFSRKVGEGARVDGALGGSEKERDLEGVLEGESRSTGRGMIIVVSIVSRILQ